MIYLKLSFDTHLPSQCRSAHNPGVREGERWDDRGVCIAWSFSAKLGVIRNNRCTWSVVILDSNSLLIRAKATFISSISTDRQIYFLLPRPNRIFAFISIKAITSFIFAFSSSSFFISSWILYIDSICAFSVRCVCCSESKLRKDTISSLLEI